MPTINAIEVSYNRKVQLEQFEPIQHGVTLSANMAQDEDAEEVYDELVDQAEDMVERALVNRVAQHEMDSDDGE